MFEVISDRDLIFRGQQLLELRFQAANPRSILCKIVHRGSGIPGNISPLPVRIMWVESVGLWFHPSDHKPNYYWNGFGLKQPIANTKVTPECEINFPRTGINRRVAAALAHDENHRTHIFHRGRLYGVKKVDFESSFRSLLVTVIDGDEQANLVHIAGLDDPDLIKKIAEFVKKVKELKSEILMRS